MRLDELAEKYVTDKRFLEHNYVEYYEKYFEGLRNDENSKYGIACGYGMVTYRYGSCSNLVLIEANR